MREPPTLCGNWREEVIEGKRELSQSKSGWDVESKGIGPACDSIRQSTFHPLESMNSSDDGAKKRDQSPSLE